MDKFVKWYAQRNGRLHFFFIKTNYVLGSDWVGPLPRKTFAQAMTIDSDGDAAYIIDGWGSDTNSNVYKIQIPKNLCSLWPNRQCLTVPDCAYCSNKDDQADQEIKNETCYSITQECPLQDLVNYTKYTNQARVCTGQLLANCHDLKDCATCLQVPDCQWCDNLCNSNKTCAGNSLNNTLECPQNTCLATDCIQCHQLKGCEWNNAENKCILAGKLEKNSFAVCNSPCMHYNSCSTCLDVKDCLWSTQLNECFSQSYLRVYCAGGVCGLVLYQNEKQYCPEPCESFTQCSTCLKHFHCGWCDVPGLNGQGVCTDGSNDRPLAGTCDQVFTDNKDILV